MKFVKLGELPTKLVKLEEHPIKLCPV